MDEMKMIETPPVLLIVLIDRIPQKGYLMFLEKSEFQAYMLPLTALGPA
jgi:hypothetical protein